MATINQKISLEGSEDILKKLEELGKIGAAAFEQIKSAAEKMRVDDQLKQTAEAANGLATAGSDLVKQFDALAEAAAGTDEELKQVSDIAAKVGEGLGQIGEAGDKAGRALAVVGDASKDVATNVAQSGDAAQKSSTSYVELGLSAVRTGAAVVQAGAGVSQASTAVASLGVQTIGAAAAVGSLAISIGSVLAGAIGVAVGALGGLGSALSSIASSDAQLSAALDRTAQKTQQIGQGFTQLQVGQAAFEQIGISAEKFHTVMVNVAQVLASFKAPDAIAASLDKISETAKKALEAEQALLEKQIELAKTDLSLPMRGLVERLAEVKTKIDGLNKDTTLADAQKAVIDSQEAAAKAVANNLTTIYNIIKQIEGGQKALEFNPLTTAESKIDAVKLRLNEVAKTGGDVSQAILNIIANLNSLDAAAVGKAFGLSETDIDRIQRYGATVTDINGLLEKIRSGGVLISPENAKTFDAMADSVQHVSSAWAQLKQAWASTIFSELAASGATAFNKLTAKILELATKGVQAFNELTKSAGEFFATIAKSDTMKSVSDTINKSVQGLNLILADVFGGIAKGAGASDEAVQKLKDTIMHFGEETKKADAAASGLAGQLSGVKTLAAETQAAVGAATTTPAPRSWQWVPDTYRAAAAEVSGKAAETQAVVATSTTTPAPSAWQWIADMFGGPAAATSTQAEETKSSVAAATTTPAPGAWQWITDTLAAILQSAAEKWAAFKASLFGGGSAPTPAPAAAGGGQFARGGLLGGRGSGTSDSNLAWVSRGEHIMPARAVRQPGVLAFLEALRHSGGNLRDVLDNMGRFALGGMVRAPIAIPAFAGGGAMSNVTIQFPGLPEITGLRASSAVVDELRKAAAMAQVRSGGRKPSRYS